MAKHKFNQGDIVQLKSGGPKMTIYETPIITDDKTYHCQWFAGAKIQFGSFEEETLIKVEEKK